MSAALERITERVNRLGDVEDPGTPTPLLTIDEFFDGNDVVGSIGCNLYPEVDPQVVRAALVRIAERPDVYDVRVAIYSFDDPDWPYAERVVIATTSTPAEVMDWFPEDLAPSDAWVGPEEGFNTEPYELAAGSSMVICWWD
ncbi:hypothetical protein [Mycolicibacterium frederiksbergense]|uniref:hypothetical protein n=1 Tax=Mycolicibacterium frederiksbergense TaxID=117567 RepID=UPI0024767795|nr:hypothetical protein [Mycolicibacterium frederiksbergense]